MQNRMKALLRQGKAVFSCTIRTPHPNLAEIAGLAGYECVMLDAEHGTVSSDTLDAMILAVRATGATPIVRVPGVDRTLVKQALDHGADGILFPHISQRRGCQGGGIALQVPPAGKARRRARTPHRLWTGGRPRLPGSGQRPGPGGAHAGGAGCRRATGGHCAPSPASISSTWVPGIFPRPMDTPSRPAIPWCCRPWTRPWKSAGGTASMSASRLRTKSMSSSSTDKGARFFESVNLEGFVAERLADYRRACQP